MSMHYVVLLLLIYLQLMTYITKKLIQASNWCLSAFYNNSDNNQTIASWSVASCMKYRIEYTYEM